MFLLFVAINHKINSATDGDFSGTVILYNCGSCLYFHFAISSFRHFVISPFRHFAISPFRVLNTPTCSYYLMDRFIFGSSRLIQLSRRSYCHHVQVHSSKALKNSVHGPVKTISSETTVNARSFARASRGRLHLIRI